MEPVPSITVGAAKLERAGDDVLIRSVKLPELMAAIPYRVLEAWCLRKLREEALTPIKES